VFDAGTGSIERFGKKSRLIARSRTMRNDGADPPLTSGESVRSCVVAFVRHRCAWRNVRADVEEDFELSAVTCLAASEMETDGLAIEVALEVDLGREPATRAAERLILLPPLAPAADTCARTTVESNICTRWALGLSDARASKKASKTPLRLNREKRFQTLFQGPNCGGSARHDTLLTVK
jgi:hypothetical protein